MIRRIFFEQCENSNTRKGQKDEARNLKPKLVVLDLAKLNFISSVGMGLLVRIQNQLKESGGRLVLAAPRPLIREALRRAALQRIFEIRDSVDEVK